MTSPLMLTYVFMNLEDYPTSDRGFMAGVWRTTAEANGAESQAWTNLQKRESDSIFIESHEAVEITNYEGLVAAFDDANTARDFAAEVTTALDGVNNTTPKVNVRDTVHWKKR